MDVALHTDLHGSHVDGGVAEVLRCSVNAGLEARVLALVVETAGSTYARAGAGALYAQGRRIAGWLTGGCLDDWIAEEAQAAHAAGNAQWLDLDLTGQHQLLDPSAPGCRGRLRIVLVPVSAWHGWDDCVHAWREGAGPMAFDVDAQRGVVAACGTHSTSTSSFAPGPESLPARRTTVDIPQPPILAVLGGGPEAPLILQLAAELGWRTIGVESRARWMPRVAQAEIMLPIGVDAFFATPHARRCAAILAMHHNVERDLLALEGAADVPARYVGLLGPRTRRDDVLRLLAPNLQARLVGRLRSPVGLPVPAKGPAAIAISVVAHLMMECFGAHAELAARGTDPCRGP